MQSSDQSDQSRPLGSRESMTMADDVTQRVRPTQGHTGLWEPLRAWNQQGPRRCEEQGHGTWVLKEAGVPGRGGSGRATFYSKAVIVAILPFPPLST